MMRVVVRRDPNGGRVRGAPANGRRLLLLSFVVLALAACGAAQETNPEWQSLQGPRASFVVALAQDPGTQSLYAGTLGGGVLVSVDGGRNWQPIDDDPAPRSDSTGAGEVDYALDVRAIAAAPDGRIYAASPGAGVFVRTAKHVWSELNRGLPYLDTNQVVLGGSNASVLYVGTRQGLYVRDLPTTPSDMWQLLDFGGGPLAQHVQTLYASHETPARLYVGTQAGFFYSVNAGQSWQQASTQMGEKIIVAMAVSPVEEKHVVVSTYGDRNIYVSVDGGRSWEESSQAFDSVVESILFSTTEPARLYAVTYQGDLYSSLDDGHSWQAEGGPGFPILSLLQTAQGRLVAGTDGYGIWFQDSGGQWENAHAPGSLLTPLSLLRHDDTLYVGTACCGVFRRVSGKDWLPYNEGLPLQARVVSSLAIDAAGETLYAGTHGGGVYGRGLSSGAWEQAGRGLQERSAQINSLQFIPDRSDGVLLAATAAGLYELQATDWEYVDAPHNHLIRAAGSRRVFATSAGGQVWESVDDGASWRLDEEAPRDVVQIALATDEGISLRAPAPDPWTLFALTEGGALYYRTSDAGWQQAHLESVASGKLSVWSSGGIPGGYFLAKVETNDSSAYPWSNLSLELEGMDWRQEIAPLQTGITVVVSDRENGGVLAGTLNKGVYRADIDFRHALQQVGGLDVVKWSVIGSIILLLAVGAALYVWRRRRSRAPGPRAAGEPDAIIVPETGERPSEAQVYDLLLAAFTPEELKRFCQHNPALRDVIRKFGTNESLEGMADEVMDYCRKRTLLPQLLEAVKEANSRQYENHRKRWPTVHDDGQ